MPVSINSTETFQKNFKHVKNLKKSDGLVMHVTFLSRDIAQKFSSLPLYQSLDTKMSS